MNIKNIKKKRVYPKSKVPYKRKSESEISRILTEINEGVITIRGACKKFGLNRNTLRLWMVKSSIRNLSADQSVNFISTMNDNQQVKALERKVRELSKALEKTTLRAESLETVIKVAESDLKIKIR